MENKEFTAYILSCLTRRDLLEQLAEEAAELSQAALKTIRAEEMNDNVTPITADEANEALLNELYDVEAVKSLLLPDAIEDSQKELDRRLSRWAWRLRIARGWRNNPKNKTTRFRDFLQSSSEN